MREEKIPRFVTEVRGGWDEWSEEREVLFGVQVESTELRSDDVVIVDDEERPELEARVELVNWEDDLQVELRAVARDRFFDHSFTEEEFQEAWGDTLRLE